MSDAEDIEFLPIGKVTKVTALGLTIVTPDGVVDVDLSREPASGACGIHIDSEGVATFVDEPLVP